MSNSNSEPPIDSTRELTGLDKIVEVITILVLKFGRATSMLLAIGGLLIICVVILVISMINFISLRSEVTTLIDRQELLVKSQERLERSASVTQKAVSDTSQKVSDTQARVETVAASTPKVKLDTKTGKAKLILPKPKDDSAPVKPNGKAAYKGASIELDFSE